MSGLFKPGTVIENNYGLVYDSNNGTLHKVTAQNLQSTIEGHGIYCSTKFDVVNSIVLAKV